MNDALHMPPIIKTALNNDWLHVFVVNNPVFAMLARMLMAAYGVDQDNVICIPRRNTHCALVSDHVFVPKNRFYYRFFSKQLCDHLTARQIIAEVERHKKGFLVYGSWMYQWIEELASAEHCRGHIYLEEGQVAYYESQPYAAGEANRWADRNNRLLQGDTRWYYRQDAEAFFGLMESSFPLAPAEKVFTLSNFSDCAVLYQPKLKGIRSIGVMPAPGRLTLDSWVAALEQMALKMPEGGAIKLHPGFTMIPGAKALLEAALKDFSGDKITLCADDVVLELEMFVEKKSFFGSRSSVSRYAEHFGSTYEYLDFFGYVQPKN